MTTSFHSGMFLKLNKPVTTHSVYPLTTLNLTAPYSRNHG